MHYFTNTARFHIYILKLLLHDDTDVLLIHHHELLENLHSCAMLALCGLVSTSPCQGQAL